MRMHLLERSQHVPLSVDDAFAFYGDADNLERITPPWLRFRILDPRPEALSAGARLEYSLRAAPVPDPVDDGDPHLGAAAPLRRLPGARAIQAVGAHAHVRAVEGGTLIDRPRAVRDSLRAARGARARGVRAPRPAPHLRLPPRRRGGAARLARRYPCAALPLVASPHCWSLPSPRRGLRVGPRGRAAAPRRRRAEPMHRAACGGPALPRPADGRPGRHVPRPLRGPKGAARDEQPQEPRRGPVMLRGRRTGKRTMRARQHIYRVDGSRLIERTGAKLYFKHIPGQGPTGSGATRRASSCGPWTPGDTASGSCGPGRRSSTACAT